MFHVLTGASKKVDPLCDLCDLCAMLSLFWHSGMQGRLIKKMPD
jgi:hypothetical protein